MNTKAIAVIDDKLTDVKDIIASSLGKPADSQEVMKYITGAMLTIKGNAKLQELDPQSIVNCLIECAQIGLAVDNRKLAHLIPFGSKCTLMPDFRGYLYKIKKADPTAEFTVGIVYKGDEFSCNKDSGQAFYTHKVKDPFEDNPHNIQGAYFYIKTSSGSTIEVMSKKEIDKVKSTSKMKSGGIWGTWEIEMIKKTVIRRGSKISYIESVAGINEVDDRFFDLKREKVTVTMAETQPMPETITPAIEHEDINQDDDAPIDPPQDVQGTTDTPQEEPQGDLEAFTGKVIECIPKSGKIPCKFTVEGFDDEFSTYDIHKAAEMERLMTKGLKAVISYETVTKGQFTNYWINSIKEK